MQLSIASVGFPQAEDEWSRLREVLIQAIAVITPKELCWRLGIKPGYLSDALEERDRKGIKAEWIPVILALAPDGTRRAILDALAAPCGYEVERRKELTPEEKLARWEERVKQEFGAAGLRLAEEMRR